MARIGVACVALVALLSPGFWSAGVFRGSGVWAGEVSPTDEGAGVGWHHPLCLGWGDVWRSRVTVVLKNNGPQAFSGVSIPLVVSKADSDHEPDGGWRDLPRVPLAGREVREIRVCGEDGWELLWAAYKAKGAQLRTDRLEPGDLLVVPFVCDAGRLSKVFIYFDNPSATAVPDYWTGRPVLLNGDMEAGRGDSPDWWTHDAPDGDHRAFWTNERPHSGEKCLAIEVKPGSQPSWIATRQKGISAVPGAKYRLKGWVRAEGVEGSAGWYVHVGNEANPMLLGPVFAAGGGTYDWKEVQAEFDVPPEATTLSVGTVLWGTGRAWFDDVSLELVGEIPYQVTVGPIESQQWSEQGRDAEWLLKGAPHGRWPRRLHVKAVNVSDNILAEVLVGARLGQLGGRRPAMDGPGIGIQRDRKLDECLVIGSVVLWPDTLQPRSVSHRYLYERNIIPSKEEESVPAKHETAVDSLRDYERLLQSPRNIIVNASFEDGAVRPAGWILAGEGTSGVEFTFETGQSPPGLGNRCARLRVSSDAKSGWYGWQQKLRVHGRRHYLVASWIKCEGVVRGDVRIHLHFHNENGGLTALGGITSIGPGISGSQSWTLLSELVQAPEDAVEMTVHLTTNSPGTVWHDGVLVAEVIPAEWIEWESAPLPEGEFTVWQVPPVVKVFRNDPPGREAEVIRVSAARGEWESVQIAVKSAEAIGGVTMEVDPPQDAGGHRLDQFQIAVVGYVPIDYPSNYFTTREPAYYRKLPRGSPGSDGWAGWWPDPLLPQNKFDLPADSVQPIWVIFRIPDNAVPGDYVGKVRLAAGGKTLREMPLVCHVWDFALPRRASLPAIYDVRLGPGRSFWGRSYDQAYREIVAFMAQRRLCPDTIYPQPSIRYEKGSVIADFTEYDRAAEWYFDTLQLPSAYTPNIFYLFGWGFPPRPAFGESPYEGQPPYPGVDRSQLRPEYKAAYQACLKAFWDHVKARGWNDRLVLYISDEPFDHLPEIREQMKALCTMIHQVDPTIPIYSSTWHHVPEWDGYITVWGLGHDGRVSPDQLRRIRETGARIWFTTDGQMCIDTPYCAVERLLPHYCFHYGVAAYEFWGVAWNTYNPYEFGWHSFIHQSDRPGESYWVRYPNGDGYLIYPGEPVGYGGLVSSIRLEQAREGVEDYEYLVLLRNGIAKAKAQGMDTSGAEAVLARAAELAFMPNRGGRYSTQMLPDPERIESVRTTVAKAIEDLLT